jgi:hypothetical protein
MKEIDINILCGMSLVDIRKEAGILFIDIGKHEKQVDIETENRWNIIYSIQLHSHWRIIDLNINSILYTSYDIYLPKFNSEYKKFSLNSFEKNLYTEEIKIWLNKFDDIKIEKIEVNYFEDLKIKFSNNSILETFMEASSNKKMLVFSN